MDSEMEESIALLECNPGRLPKTTSANMEEEGVQADVFFDPDMYDAVTASAFGGVRVNLAKDASMVVHPLWLFLLALPLWVMQLSALMFLRLDQDLEQTVHLHHGSGRDSWQLQGNMLLTMKLMFIVIVQFSLFKELLGAIQLLVFVLNPTTWTDIKRPNPRRMKSFGKFMFYSGFVAPFPILAMILKTSVAYVVCVDSISIILASTTEKQVIFDSLVITFIADLDEVWWNVCSMVFHFDDFGSFEMKTASHEFVREARSNVFFPGLHQRLTCLRRAESGRKIETLLSFTIMFLFYSRQFVVILYAFDTNVLPIARDVCTMWRWEMRKEKWLSSVPSLYRIFEKYVLVMDIRDRLIEVGNWDDICVTSKYDRMRGTDVARMIYEYPGECAAMLAILVTIFFAPQVIYLINGQLSSAAVQDVSEFDGDEDEEHSLRQQLERLRTEVEALSGRRLSSGSATRRGSSMSSFRGSRATSAIDDEAATATTATKR
eukprot:TRINITY_DN18654_c1_g1_i1.p1 TRINITY_DN18654_c1_g1~~TRINITY_DN18654_c1_g1_i1.p1  ORF type:complete len:490 (+),score=96.03 TRINITY_DN18654_c1_g1_i1:289-1758(+)